MSAEVRDALDAHVLGWSGVDCMCGWTPPIPNGLAAPFTGQHREHLAEVILASDWLAADRERVRASERERLAAGEVEAAGFSCSCGHAEPELCPYERGEVEAP